MTSLHNFWTPHPFDPLFDTWSLRAANLRFGGRRGGYATASTACTTNRPPTLPKAVSGTITLRAPRMQAHASGRACRYYATAETPSLHGGKLRPFAYACAGGYFAA